MLGKVEGRRRRGRQRMRRLDGITSLTQGTWVWANSGNRWRTGKPGVLQSMGSQRVGHDRVTELNWTCFNHKWNTPCYKPALITCPVSSSPGSKSHSLICTVVWHFYTLLAESPLVEVPRVLSPPRNAPMCMLSLFSHISLFAALWSVALQAPLSMGFSRQEPWSRLPCPPPGHLPDLGMEPTSLMSLALAGGFFTTVLLRKLLESTDPWCSQRAAPLQSRKLPGSSWLSNRHHSCGCTLRQWSD